MAIGLAVLLAACPAGGTAFTPIDKAQVLERLPYRAGDRTARELAKLRAAVAKSPHDVEASADLARRYFELALSRGDPRFIGYADAVITRFDGDLPPLLQMMRGKLRQYRHDFDGALQDFGNALARDPELAGAHAWRGAIFLVMAEYASAEKECNALQAKQRTVLAAGCNGLRLAYTGHLETAGAMLQGALDQTHDDAQRLWLHTRLGEAAAWQGSPARAEQQYRKALALGLDDGYLLAAWSDFLLDQGRLQDIMTLLANWENSDPLLLRLALAADRLKSPHAPRLIQTLADRFAAARMRADTTHLAEEARFELALRQDAKTALRLAADNYRVQKEPRDARILLEAALANQDRASARPALQWLKESGFQDARLRALAQRLERLAAGGGS